MDIDIHPIRYNGTASTRNFHARWRENGHDLRFIFTIGQATASGQRRVDIKSWHNGNLPMPAIRDCIINSSLLAIKRRMESPKIGATQNRRHLPSPSIPLLESREKQFGALYGACGTEIAMRIFIPTSSFGAAMPDTHIFVQNDNDMMEGFLAHGAHPRLFGNSAMIPGMNVLKKGIG